MRAKSQAEVPTFKAGDKILITKYISLQREKFEEIMVSSATPIPLLSPHSRSFLLICCAPQGLVIARHGQTGLNATFTIRNRVMGEGYEMTFPLFSPFIKKIEVLPFLVLMRLVVPAGPLIIRMFVLR